MSRLIESLQRRMAALTATNRQLRRDVARRASAEAVLKRRSERYSKLWKESRVLQQDLRRLTHQMLRAQEDQQTHLSNKLHDVVGQTLLGINIKLLALRRGTKDSRRSIAGGISSTQRMLKASALTVGRATKGLGKS